MVFRPGVIQDTGLVEIEGGGRGSADGARVTAGQGSWVTLPELGDMGAQPELDLRAPDSEDAWVFFNFGFLGVYA